MAVLNNRATRAVVRKKRWDCLVAGDANADLLLEGETALEEGREVLARRIDLVLGGSSSITAFNLSRLGARVGFAGVVGANWLGEFVAGRIVAGGMDVAPLRRLPRERAGITVWLTRHGKQAAVTYAGTIARLRAVDLTDQLLGQARALACRRLFHAGRLTRGRRRGLSPRPPAGPDHFARLQRRPAAGLGFPHPSGAA